MFHVICAAFPLTFEIVTVTDVLALPKSIGLGTTVNPVLVAPAPLAVVSGVDPVVVDFGGAGFEPLGLVVVAVPFCFGPPKSLVKNESETPNLAVVRATG